MSKVFTYQRKAEILVNADDLFLKFGLLPSGQSSALYHVFFSVTQRGPLEQQHFRSELAVVRGKWVFEMTALTPLITSFGWSNILDVVRFPL